MPREGENARIPADGHMHTAPEGGHMHAVTRLEAIVEELEDIAESVGEAMALAPSGGAPAAGGERPDFVAVGETLRSGIRHAGPVAAAGVLSNGTNVLVTVFVSRLLHTHQYGSLAQLLGLFVVLSMPGSAVLVGVVRRVTSWESAGQADRVQRWSARLHAWGTLGVLAFVVITWAIQGWVAHQLSLPSPAGVVPVFTAGAVWILLSVDRGLLQAHRSYRSLAGNLVLEAGVRSVCIVALVGFGFGVGGACLGLLLCEVAASIQARWMVLDRPRRSPWGAPLREVLWRSAHSGSPPVGPAGRQGDTVPAGRQGDTVPAGRQGDTVRHGRRDMVVDVSVAMLSLALLGILQNADVILVGREAPGNAGGYAAISVASKALVFGALALAGYLLPEATIRWHHGHHAVRQLGVTLVLLAVPAVVLFGLSVAAPRAFLRLVFSARLDTAALAFAPLVGAMIFLGVTVVLTIYLLGVGCRWIVYFLGIGAVSVVSGTALAHGRPVLTARADLVVQSVLALALAIAFVLVHRRSGRSQVLRPDPTGRAQG